ncbi:MAG: hypothetical protein WDZ41_02690 [Candidatus Babeliales bacterium]
MIQQQRGFLLIECALVLVILMFFYTLCVNTSHFMHNYFLRAELNKIYALFFYLQKRAIITQQEHVLKIDVHQNNYTVLNRSEKLPSGIFFGFLFGSAGPPSAPKELISKPVTFSQDCVHFYPDGTMSAGTLYLKDQNNSLMYALTSPVAHISYLRTYAYRKDSWVLLS